MNENENMTTPNLWDSVQEKNKINNLTLYLKQKKKKK